jgi:hypothetical protein
MSLEALRRQDSIISAWAGNSWSIDNFQARRGEEAQFNCQLSKSRPTHYLLRTPYIAFYLHTTPYSVHATYKPSTNMVINPTYLAQRTRTCQSHTLPSHPIPSHPAQPSINLPSAPPLTSHPLSTAVNWPDARRRVLKSYREWLRAVRHSTSLPSRFPESRAEYILRK